jgi:hypothetical protein
MFTVLVMFFAWIPTAASGAILATRVNPATGHTYHLLTRSTWTAAESEAISLGGHLVTVNNAAEQEWLGGFLDLGIPIFDSLWIGLTDAAQEGTWVWASGEPVLYTNWERGEPNNAHDGTPGGPAPPGDPGEDYVQVFAQRKPVWNDIKDARPLFPHPNGVVEIAPEPAAAALMAIGLTPLVRRRARVRRVLAAPI